MFSLWKERENLMNLISHDNPRLLLNFCLFEVKVNLKFELELIMTRYYS